MMRELTQQVHTRALAERFVGDVVLAPGAVADLLSWLMGQLRDGPLIDGSSVYRDRVGEPIASPLLTLQSRYDAPGCVPVTSDAFVAPAVTLLDAGRLTQLTPSLYGSRKTGVYRTARWPATAGNCWPAARRWPRWWPRCRAARWSTACRWAARRPTATSPA
jgi:predicted Zn-dependent protease